MNLDYYYGIEAEQFAFYRIPKILIKDERFKNISRDAKLLYGLLLDRMSLSIKNGWLDAENRVYIYYSTDELCEDLNCSKPTVVKIMAELDSVKGIGLIEKKRQGFGKPDMIYVKNFVKMPENSETLQKNTVQEMPENNEENIEAEKLNILTSVGKQDSDYASEDTGEVRADCVQKLKFLTSSGKKILPQEVKNFNPNNPEYNNPDMNNHSFSNGNISLEKQIYELMKKYPEETDILKVIADVVTETVQMHEEYLRVGGNYVECRTVQKQLQKLERWHIEYVLVNMSISNNPIHNIRSYLLTALYQATLLTDECISAQLRCNQKKVVQQSQQSSGNKFNNFHQRRYDDDNIEKLLIANGEVDNNSD